MTDSTKTYQAAWTTGFTGNDPLGFDAGDANLRRVVGNDPTNATDPMGLEAVTLSGNGQDWSFNVNKPEKLAINTGDGANAVKGTLYIYDRAGLSESDEGILFRYVGEGADNVRFIQTMNVSVFVREIGWRWDATNGCYDGVEIGSQQLKRTIPHDPEHVAQIRLSVPKNPAFYLDIKKDAKDPYYPRPAGVDAKQNTSWMWDDPQTPQEIAKEFGLPFLKNNPDPSNVGLRPWPPGDATYVVTQSFNTYVIVGGKEVALVQWESQSEATVTGRYLDGPNRNDPPKFSVSAPTITVRYQGDPGGEAPLPQPDLPGMLKDRFGPRQSFVNP